MGALETLLKMPVLPGPKGINMKERWPLPKLLPPRERSNSCKEKLIRAKLRPKRRLTNSTASSTMLTEQDRSQTALLSLAAISASPELKIEKPFDPLLLF